MMSRNRILQGGGMHISSLRFARVITCVALGVVLTGSAAFAGQSAAAKTSEKLTVMNPTGIAPPITLKAMAPRPQSLDGRTVYLVDVTFNGGDLFLQQMQKWMTANVPAVKTVLRTKKGVYAADDPELWKEIKSVNGLMIMAIGH